MRASGRVRRALRWPLRAAATLLWLLAAVLAALIAWRLAGLPQTRGELTLAGLREPVSVLRDAHGVPHIFAAHAQDAVFALGFVHGQDRMWQLEMNRRIVAGRLSELLGPATLETDRFLRTLGIARNGQATVTRLDPDTQRLLRAYADGVNAAIAQTDGAPWKLSPEFLMLGARPEPWTPADSAGWLTMMAWDLSGNFSTELLRFSLSQRLDATQLAQLFDLDPATAPDLARLYRGIGRPQSSLLTDPMPPTMLEGVGSNNWVVDGTRTTSGRPLLANDPHLGLSSPGLWYLAHLSAPGLQTIGATLPGLPYVVLGRTERVAWGFTNTGPDTQDLYLERVDPQRPDHYATPTGPAPFVTRTETIRVKGQPDETITVRETRHGPVISDVSAAAAQALSERGAGASHVLAFAWTALTPDDRSLVAGFRLNRARSGDELLDALRDFLAPQQNIVWADVEGRIGMIAPGRIPVRRADNELRGLAPAPGWDARYDWVGWIPFEQLPRVSRALDGAIVTANQKIVGDDYPWFLTAEWTRPHRHDRIRALLQTQDRHDAASFARIQGDTLSLAMRELLPSLLATQPGGDTARTALAMLRDWDGDMAADRPEPLIATAWLDRLRRSVFEDEVGAAGFRSLEPQRGRLRALERVLTQPAWQVWCDRVDTPATETCAQLLTASLDEALADLTARFGPDPQRWRWAQAHVAVLEHRPFGKHPLLSRLFDLRVPTPGDASTVYAGRAEPLHPSEPYANRWGPAYRAIYDLADLERSQFIHSSGQSGHRLSPRYGEFVERWARVEYVPMRMDRATIERESRESMVLRPR